MIGPSDRSRRPLVRARAALRLGLGGGGTDLPAYCDHFGGAVLNATIDRYVEATIAVPDSEVVRFVDDTTGEVWQASLDHAVAGGDGGPPLHRAVYRSMVTRFHAGRPFPIEITTSSEAPLGSGLGASSTLVVAMVAACVELQGLALSQGDIARLACDIERREAGLPGGRQDQFAAACGGMNFLEFHTTGRVTVSPVDLAPTTLAALEQSLLLFYTGIARDSAAIIMEQERRVCDGSGDVALEAMHRLKACALRMRASLVRGDLADFYAATNESWDLKKQTAPGISNVSIEWIRAAAMCAGAVAGKVSGAGGGGYVVLFVDPAKRAGVVRALDTFNGRVEPCHFTSGGVQVRACGESE
jgi:D-glycero-alpha-D-manno-heptose-7-phosphate kinase